MVYAPGTDEKDLTKLNMSLQQNAAANKSNSDSIATNTAAIAANTASIAAISPVTYTEYNVLVADFVTLVSGTSKTIVSGSFAAGRWLVQGNIVWASRGSTSYTELHQCLSLTDNTLETSPAGGSTFADHLTWATGQSAVRPTGMRYFDLNTTTTIYLIGLVTNTGSPMDAYGNLFGISLP